jgi:hypothetical protein
MLMRSYLTLSTPQFIIDFEKWVAQPIGEALILNLFYNTDCCFTLTGCNVILHKTDPLKLPKGLISSPDGSSHSSRKGVLH